MIFLEFRSRLKTFFSRIIFSSDIINRPFQTVEVPVESVEKIVNLYYKNHVEYYKKYGTFENDISSCKFGTILQGGWDKRNKPYFDEALPYIALNQRFVEKKSWDKTAYYKRFINRVKFEGGGRGNHKNWNQFKKNYLYKIDNLYKEIKINGYKSQKELNEHSSNEVQVCISRDGEILFRDGRHRLSIAKILNIKSIPVIVYIWHKKYIDLIKNNIEGKIIPSTAIKPILNECKYDFK